jgi:hypothetical protein
LTALLAVKVGILRGVHSRDRSNDVRTVGQFKSSPEFALRVSRTLQALQFFDEIQADFWASWTVEVAVPHYVALP